MHVHILHTFPQFSYCMDVHVHRRGSRVKVLGGLLGAWKICARERSDRAGGGCGRGGGGLGLFENTHSKYAFLSMVNTCFKGRI